MYTFAITTLRYVWLVSKEIKRGSFYGRSLPKESKSLIMMCHNKRSKICTFPTFNKLEFETGIDSSLDRPASSSEFNMN